MRQILMRTAWILSLFMPWFGCDVKVKSKDACGDGFADPGEECDGADLAEQTCASLGFYDVSSLPNCNADCTFDTLACGERCGDGVLQTAFGEACDADQLAGATCRTLGFTGGALACGADCQLDLSGCDSLCGNGTVDPSEPCDGFDLRGQTCAGLGYGAGALACLATCQFDEAGCVSSCGDGLAEPDEACDGAALRGLTCEALGFAGGTLACAGDCTLDTAGCTGGTSCGDGALDEGEACDGADLGGADCFSLGFEGGVLECGADCRPVTRRCLGSQCGDGVADEDEDCDGADLGGSSCASLGLGLGALACGSDCRFATAGCVNVCGNGQVDPEAGETCDGTDLGGFVCYSGTAACDAGCRLDLAGCAQYCGDGVVDEGWGEVCDGAELGALPATCGELGWAGGQPTCRADCAALDYGACLPWTSLAAAQLHRTCAVDVNGHVWCWGVNKAHDADYYYVLGDRQNLHTNCYGDCSLVPVRVVTDANLTPLADVTALALGINHSCALRSDGTVWCWGRNLYGQLGDGTNTDRVTPVQVSTLLGVTGVACNGDFCCARTSLGAAWCWGRNHQGQLGNDLTTNSATRVRVLHAADPSGFLSGVERVETGPARACALKTDGTLWCWGAANLGDGTTTASRVPVQVLDPAGTAPLNGVTHFSVFSNTCVRRSDGAVLCWGPNTQGSAGDQTNTPRSLPVFLLVQSGLDPYMGAADVNIGENHSCLIRDDRTAWCWGGNLTSQLGIGGTWGFNYPVQVVGYQVPHLLDVAQLAGSEMGSCARTQDGRIYCWGANGGGRFGDGTQDSHGGTPFPVHGPLP